LSIPTPCDETRCCAGINPDETKEYKRCYNYNNNTRLCNKGLQPQYKYAVGPLSVAMERTCIIPDIKENKPAIAYANACFLPNNYT